MNNGKHILIGDNSFEFGRLLSKTLEKRGFNVLCRRNDLNMLKDEIIASSPDCAVICIYGNDDEALKVISEIKKSGCKTGIIAAAYTGSSVLCRNIINSGAERCIQMPTSIKFIISVIYEISCAKFLIAFEPEIVSFLIERNFPSHLNGFYYLATAMGFSIVNPDYLSDVTETLYIKLAEIYNTTPLIIERSIRHVAQLVHDNGSDLRIIADSSLNFSRNSKEPLTNYELICLAADAFSEKYGLFNE